MVQLLAIENWRPLLMNVCVIGTGYVGLVTGVLVEIILSTQSCRQAVGIISGGLDRYRETFNQEKQS